MNFACEIGLLMNGELNTMFNVKIALFKQGYLKDLIREINWLNVISLRFKKSHTA